MPTPPIFPTLEDLEGISAPVAAAARALAQAIFDDPEYFYLSHIKVRIPDLEGDSLDLTIHYHD